MKFQTEYKKKLITVDILQLMVERRKLKQQPQLDIEKFTDKLVM